MNKKLGLFIIIIFSLVVVIWAYFYLLLPRDIFAWDESHHALYGLNIFRDLKYFDLVGFWQDTNHQAWWPFLHSWFLGPAFLFFGVTYATARSVSLFFFFIGVILTYLLACRIDEKTGWKVGLIASAFLLTSPVILNFGTSCMLEIMGMVLSLIVISLFLRTYAKKEWTAYLYVGLALGAAYLTKYEFFTLLAVGIAATGLTELIEILYTLKYTSKNEDKPELLKKIKKSKKDKNKAKGTNYFASLPQPLKDWLIKYGLIAIVSLVFIIGWIYTPPTDRKIGLMTFKMGEATGQTAARASFDFVTRFSFYLHSLLTEFNFSLPIGLIMLVSFLYSFRWFKIIKYRILIFAVIIPYFMLSTVIEHQEARLFLPLAPFLFILSGFALNKLYYEIRDRNFKLAIILAILLALFFTWELRRMPSEVIKQCGVVNLPFDKKQSQQRDILEYFREAIPDNCSISSGIIGSNLTPYTQIFHFYDWHAPFYGPYMIKDPAFLSSEYFISLEVRKDSPYYQDLTTFENGLLGRWNEYLNNMTQHKLLDKYTEKDFPELGIKALIYHQRAKTH